MDDRTETTWRSALQQRGKEWVQSQLRMRPGRPDDFVYDVVFEAPYPTRAFCMRWCAEEDNKLFRMSWHNYVAIFMLLLFIVCFCQAVGSWKEHELVAARHLDAPLQVAPDRVGSSAPDFSGGTSAMGSAFGGIGSSNSSSSASGRSSTSSSSSTSGQPPSLCSYITYDTTRCPAQQH
jgi:hypothetical protein